MPRRCTALLAVLFALPIGAQAVPGPESAHFEVVVAEATKALCDKRIAVLAELPSHGEGQAFALKAAIARRLVERCGFETVAFEAPIYEFLELERRWGFSHPSALDLDRAIGKFWWARELAGFRRWLHGQAESRRLRLVGIDDQISTTSVLTRSFLPARIADRNGNARTATCLATVARHLDWSYDDRHHFGTAEQRELLQCARDAASAAGTPKGAALSSDGATGAPIDAAMVNNFASYVARQLEPADSRSRDDALAANLLWHLAPGTWHLARGRANSKIIVWTATVHGSKQGGLEVMPMGKRLADRYGNGFGVVAISAYPRRIVDGRPHAFDDRAGAAGNAGSEGSGRVAPACLARQQGARGPGSGAIATARKIRQR
ncbi:MAG: erythromycin esterase family protein [Xanthomonadales bacterium]|nr:erythromycin esterase family protein [Xanthomonadales bacterium]